MDQTRSVSPGAAGKEAAHPSGGGCFGGRQAGMESRAGSGASSAAGGGQAFAAQLLDRRYVDRGEGVDAQRAAQQQVRQLGVDRKSTRLNSSHVSNSYAVFCQR